MFKNFFIHATPTKALVFLTKPSIYQNFSLECHQVAKVCRRSVNFLFFFVSISLRLYLHLRNCFASLDLLTQLPADSHTRQPWDSFLSGSIGEDKRIFSREWMFPFCPLLFLCCWSDKPNTAMKCNCIHTLSSFSSPLAVHSFMSPS